MQQQQESCTNNGIDMVQKAFQSYTKKGETTTDSKQCVEVDFIDVVAYKKHSLVALSSWYYGPQSKSFLASWVNQCFGFCCSKDIKSIVNLSAPLFGKYTLQASKGLSLSALLMYLASFSSRLSISFLVPYTTSSMLSYLTF